MSQAPFNLRGRNPDVLTCIANLSSDEVFTPPELASRMLDDLAAAWAENSGGADIWSDPTVTFLDPCTKSGVFLREIAKRLTEGLADAIPDLEKRVDHILMNQVFGIALTQLTGLMARRSLYCSKWANGVHSIGKSFTTEQGNIWFDRVEHSWVGGTSWVLTADENGNEVKKPTNGKCEFCGASQTKHQRSADLETHAHGFLHTSDINARMAELFGGDMKFDVIIGNPPYQLEDGGYGSSGGAVYNKFVEQAKALEPRILTMVVPARWYAGGKGLSGFRNAMLSDGRIRTLHDFPNTSEVFPGVNNRGGICYFLWDRDYSGETEVFTHEGGEITSAAQRPLLEAGLETFIRYNEGVSILRKVVKQCRGGLSDELTLPPDRRFSAIVSSRKPFGLDTTFAGRSSKRRGDVKIYRKGGVCFAPRTSIPSGQEMIDATKLFVPYSSPGNDDYPHLVLSRPIVAGPGEAATETYLLVGPFESEAVARNAATYMGTQFFRFMLTLLRVSQHVTRGVYELAPTQDFFRSWNDDELADLYGLTDEDREFMARFVKPVSWAGDYS